MNKKVLVTVSGGVPSVYAEPSVDVVVIDYEDAKAMRPDEMIPIHSSFQALMDFCGAADAWPVADNGRRNDADYLEPSEPFPEIALTLRRLTLEKTPIDWPVY